MKDRINTQAGYIDQLCNSVRILKEQHDHIVANYSTLENVYQRDEAIKKKVRILEADLAELIRKDTERLFSPDQIWWEKKLYLVSDPETADINFATFLAYLAKKYKASEQDLNEWSLLAARTVG